MATVSVPLSSRKYPGMFALVDEEDAPLVTPYHWGVLFDGHHYYARTWGTISLRKRRSFMMHRLIMGVVDNPGTEIDHVHREDTLDNRRENLREATRSANNANRRLRKDSQSGYKGVIRRPNGRWRAKITVNKRQIQIGEFPTAVEAAKAYDAAAREHFGPYARFNFPSVS